LVVLVNATVAPLTKPVPVTVSNCVAVPAVNVAGESVATVGAGVTTSAPANGVGVTTLSSVSETVYVPGVVAAVDAKLAVPAVVEDSMTLVKVTPGAVVERLTFPPSLTRLVPVNEIVPVAPDPMIKEPAVGVISVTLARAAGVPAALASVAAANGSAAASITAPAARALTMWRGIRRKVFIKNPSFVGFIFINSIY
jgi:hypothetical protein